MAKMRLAYYAAASMMAAAGVVLKALHDRPNFYSASVQLSQSPISYGILLNLLLLSFGTLAYGLQLLLFGPLRVIERERLYERSWISVTETLLIMMTFRDDISFHFLFLLANLVVCRMWSWLCESRIEMLEQQPPAHPRLFHARLSASLGTTLLLDAAFLKHCVGTVLDEARPGMMVMYAFEFAVLGISCVSNLLRYLISLYEISMVKRQTNELLSARRDQVRRELAAAQTRAREAGEDEEEAVRGMARPEDVDENEVEAAGWEAKGQWVFALDISTDFFRLVIYLAFFTLLLLFHGLPIHILRDVYVTLHSFLKRIHSFVQYRNATRDMNSKFPDATGEELANENTCIVCREEMHVWHEVDGQGRRNDQRARPKKLPCGHILHFTCLRSWLERQQVCPTCRRSVLAPPGAPGRAQPPRPGGQRLGPLGGARAAEAQPQAQAAQHHNQFPNGLHHVGPNGQMQGQDGNRQAPANPQQRRRRQIDFRLPFLGHRIVLDWGPVDPQVLQQYMQRQHQLQNQASNEAVPGQAGTSGPATTTTGASAQGVRGVPTQADLVAYERAVSRELLLLNISQAQLAHLRVMQNQLSQLRHQYAQAQLQWEAALPANGQASAGVAASSTYPHITSRAQAGPSFSTPASGATAAAHNRAAETGAATAQSDTPGAMPPGLVVPEGWTVIPLTPTNAPAAPAPASLPSVASAAQPPPVVPGAQMPLPMAVPAQPPPGAVPFPTPTHLMPGTQGPQVPPVFQPQGPPELRVNEGPVAEALRQRLSQQSSGPRAPTDNHAASATVPARVDATSPAAAPSNVEASMTTRAPSAAVAESARPGRERVSRSGEGADANLSGPSAPNVAESHPVDSARAGWNFGSVPVQNPVAAVDAPATESPQAESTVGNGATGPEGADLTAGEPSTTEQQTRDKGKGRAVTVEDVDEPVD